MDAPNPGTLFVGSQVIRLPEVDSTNSYALRMIRNTTVQEGCVVRADFQSNGRGQRGAEWKGERGKNIACSVIFKPVFLEVDQQFDLTRAVALAVADMFTEYFPLLKVNIKWPNDIYAADKKVAGILVENIISGNTLQYAVVGIGINLDQETFPPELPDAISVFQLTGSKTDHDEVYRTLYSALEARYLQLRGGKTEKIRSDYESCLFRKGIMSRFTDFKSVFSGKIISVDPGGKIQIEKENGEKAGYAFKEIGMLLH
ncbi:MAG TPA: biotin--[acetyl-CoA-carboxylase] ligase [Bacteroidia bacterium]|jgi:BirA family biotin operon repressor/biotin-[acetyl-CoA-carboxylase] ligase|nr:biotin--[acetyl-CoA-carboxylase] ligase [Bacteroidia bacterium]